MFDFSPIQIVIVLVIALVVFGPKRLPEMGRNLGRGLREFKGSISGMSGDAPAQTTTKDPASGGSSTLARDSAKEEVVEARQKPPAPTPEVAEAEAADEKADDNEADDTVVERPAAEKVSA